MASNYDYNVFCKLYVLIVNATARLLTDLFETLAIRKRSMIRITRAILPWWNRSSTVRVIPVYEVGVAVSYASIAINFIYTTGHDLHIDSEIWALKWKYECLPSEDSNKFENTPSLIKAFTVHSLGNKGP